MREIHRREETAEFPSVGRMIRHYLFRAVLLLAYSIYIVYLVQSGNLHHYIAPRMEILVKLAAIGLLLVAGAQIWMALGTKREDRMACDCCDPDPVGGGIRRNGLLYPLFLLPLLAGFLLPDGVSGSELAAVKGISFGSSIGSEASLEASSSDREGGPTAADPYNEDFAKLAKLLAARNSIDVPEEGFLEVLRAVDLELDRFVGKRMTVSGFVYRENAMKGDEFAVARLVMSCCAADASSYGVRVRLVKGRQWEPDAWVTVSGMIGKGTYEGNPVLTLSADRISEIPAPDNPYVYLYTGDYADLVRW